MEPDVGFFDVIAMLGMFIVGFFMWVAWELIIGNKFFALFLAIGTFIVTWQVAGFIGADAPIPFLIVEALVATVIFRVANRGKEKEPSQ